MKKFIKIVMIMFFTCFKGSYAANNTELYKKIDDEIDEMITNMIDSIDNKI